MKLTSRFTAGAIGLTLVGAFMSQPAARAQIAVSVNCSTVVRTLPATFNGVNYVSFWDDEQGDDASREALRRSGATLLRFPGGTPASWTDWANPYYLNLSATSALDLWNYAKQIGMTPLYQTCATTNENNDPSGPHAAAFITYCQQNGINAPFVEVNDEPDNGMPSADDTSYLQWYFTAFNNQAPAMKAVNSNLTVLGGALTNVYYWWQLDSLNMFLNNCGSNADAVSLHYYDGSLSSAEDWTADWNYIRSVTNKPIYVTEWNAEGGTGTSSEQCALMLANADTIGAFAVTGVQAHCFFGDIHGVNNGWGILYGDYQEPRASDTPAPCYFILPLWAKMGNEVLNVTNPANPATVLAAYSQKRSSDGSVQVMLINKGASQTVNLTFTGYTLTNQTVNVYECKASSGNATDMDVLYNNVLTPNVATTDLPGPLTQVANGTTFTRTLPPYSITVLDFPNGAPTTPAAPTGLSATPGGSEISLWWTAVTGATTYNVSRSTASGGPYTLIANTNSVGFSNTGLTDGTTYYYVVTAVNSAGTSGNSSQVSGTPAVRIPNFVAVQASIGNVNVTWEAADGATSYNVNRATVSGGPYTTLGNTTSLSYTDSTVTNGVTYYYVVAGKDAVGVSANSREQIATPTSSIQINTGGPAVSPFIADTEYNAGSDGSNTATAITTGQTNPAPLAVYQTERYGTFTYTIGPLVPSSSYVVRLHFTEDYDTVAGARIFNVSINGTQVLNNFDIFAATGSQHTLTIQQFGANSNSSGQIAIAFLPNSGCSDPNAKVDAIEVLPGAPSVPSTPTGLTSTGGIAQVALAWNASSGATSYNVLRSTVSGSGYASVVTGLSTVSYTNTGLTNGTTYYFVVTAVNSVGTSGYSNQASATPQTGAPAAPTGLTATAGSGQVSLSWTASSGATSYNVLRATVSGSGYASVVTGLSATNYTNTGLTNGTTYYYVVTAVNSGGTSGNSNQASATPATSGGLANPSFETPALAAGAYQYNPTGGSWTFASNSGIANNGSGFGNPTAPNGVQVAFIQGNNGVNGTISQSMTFTAGNYTISFESCQRSPDSQSIKVYLDSTLITTITPTSTSFAIYTTPSFAATAGSHVIQFTGGSTSGDNTAFIDSVAINPAGGSAPAAPTGLTAIAGNTQVVLAWTASSGATSYNVYRGTSAGGESATAIATGLATTSYTNTGLTNGTKYYFTVKALNAVGTSPASNEASATPQVSAPAAPTGLTAAGGNAQVALTWTASTGATSYNVLRSTVNGSGYSSVTMGITTTAYTNTGLTNGATYYFVVTAVNSGGTSGNSNQASATPSAGGNSVTNPSFETPVESGYVYNPTGGTWTFGSSSGICSNGSGFGNPNAPNGTQVAFLQTVQGNGWNGTITQSATFTAGSHTLSFQACQRNGNSQTIQILIDGTQVATVTPTSTSFAAYTTTSFTTTAGAHTLQLAGDTANGDQTAFIDVVTIN